MNRTVQGLGQPVGFTTSNNGRTNTLGTTWTLAPALVVRA